MSRLIGDRLPAPIRFEFGRSAIAGGAGRCVLLATADENGAVSVAVLDPAEVEPLDDRRLQLHVRPDGTTAANLRQRKHATLWYVLDAAAYTIQGRVAGEETVDTDLVCTIEIAAVLQDFREDAPMISGPTYRPPAGS